MTLRLRPAVFSVTSLGISVAGPGNNLYKDPVGREFGAFKKMEKPRAKRATGNNLLPDVEIAVWKQKGGSTQLW